MLVFLLKTKAFTNENKNKKRGFRTVSAITDLASGMTCHNYNVRHGDTLSTFNNSLMNSPLFSVLVIQLKSTISLSFSSIARTGYG